jgi:hypothetical protein
MTRLEGNRLRQLIEQSKNRPAPTPAQQKTLEKTLVDLMKTYKVRKGAVYTHREWPDAQTACPGRNLQTRMVELRRGTRLA